MTAPGWCRSPRSLRPRSAEKVSAIYFVVEPDRQQLVELADLVNDGTLRLAIDSTFPLADAGAAFERVMASGKRGKVAGGRP